MRHSSLLAATHTCVRVVPSLIISDRQLANPHYKPEMQAQTTLINFTVTRDGLEDQLLAQVVAVERPDLEQLKSDLTRQQNEFKIVLKKLEDDLLARLSAAGKIQTDRRNTPCRLTVNALIFYYSTNLIIYYYYSTIVLM